MRDVHAPCCYAPVVSSSSSSASVEDVELNSAADGGDLQTVGHIAAALAIILANAVRSCAIDLLQRTNFSSEQTELHELICQLSSAASLQYVTAVLHWSSINM